MTLAGLSEKSRPGLQRLGDVILSLKDALFPLRCLCCGRLFLRPGKEGGALGVYLCEPCRKDVVPVRSPLCPRCGMVFKERGNEDHLCGDCLIKPGKLDFSRGIYRYDRAMKPLIQAYKYRGKIQVARPLARLLFELYCQIYLEDDTKKPCPDLVFPVPLHRKRFRKRGFNQAWLLICDWPEWFQEIDGQRPLCVKDGLTRHRWTEPQAGLDRKKRQSNLKGAFSLKPDLSVTGKCVLLIDDVFTTGATAQECAKVLKKNGAGAVHIFTIARA